MLKRGAPVEYSDMINSELIRRLNEQRVTLRAQLAEQSSTLLDSSPAHQGAEGADQRSGPPDSRRGRAACPLVRERRTIAGARLESLQGSLDQLKQQAASTNGQDVELRALEREAKAQRDLLESYLAKYRETTARDSLGPRRPTRASSRARWCRIPRIFPKKLPIVLVATLAALFISAGFITTGELLAGNVYRAGAPVEPPAEPVPAVGRAARAEAAGARAQAELAAQGLHPRQGGRRAGKGRARRGRGSKQRAFRTRKGHHDRRSRCRAARSRRGRQARRGHQRSARERRDADGRRARASARERRARGRRRSRTGAPELASITLDPRAPGIADLVRGTASFGQIITRDRISRVQVVPAGRVGTEAAMVFMSERLNIAMDALSRSYDHVVIDAGAAPYVPADRIARLASCAVLVAGNVTEEAANTTRDHLANAGFSDIALFTGTAPALDAESIGSVAA